MTVGELIARLSSVPERYSVIIDSWNPDEIVEYPIQGAVEITTDCPDDAIAKVNIYAMIRQVFDDIRVNGFPPEGDRLDILEERLYRAAEVLE